MRVDVKAFPLFLAAGALLCANLSAFSYPWVDVNINVSDGAFTYQSDASIGLLQCSSVDCTPNYCCSSYNDGKLFKFPAWGLYVFPTFANLTGAGAYADIVNVLVAFQYASYPVLFLITISSVLCIGSLVITLFSIVYRSAYFLKDQGLPLRIAILCNCCLIVEYFITSVWFLNGGAFSFGFWITAYATAIATIGYYISFRANLLQFQEPGRQQELIYLFNQNDMEAQGKPDALSIEVQSRDGP